MKKTDSRGRRLVAVALWTLMVTAPAAATTILPQNLTALSAESSHVLRGTVGKIHSRWNVDQTLIETDVVLTVSDAFKGKAAGDVTVTVLGGRIGDLVLDVIGTPTFTVGEDVLLFLRRGTEGAFMVPSLYQGKYHLETDTEGNVWISNAMYPLEQALPQQKSALDADGRMPWSKFAAELDRALAGGER